MGKRKETDKNRLSLFQKSRLWTPPEISLEKIPYFSFSAWKALPIRKFYQRTVFNDYITIKRGGSFFI